ncbi:septal ring lytic transglycosylase RlpA family protein [Salinisphaera orenii]|uniref:Endolytic peptidoglycan transglycosylase RlpA n=1 Tax=Salinisphaera orenii YIM 95161 TaxID=1051139 RepID=A0A423PHQ7_9GAMM|nr:septal ring lytic transglycosylase RlpA family protein [Salinisphaera halophila]ROO25095.1 hypothetical protein SAHL_15035 [Salinisphaera halophila YIM 95161]
MRGAWIPATATLAALMLAGCASTSGSGAGGSGGGGGGGYYQNDGPPDDERIDLDSIEDAVPRDEPKSKYGNPASYEALGKTYYVLESAAGFSQTGRASWYGRQFHGRRTSSGEDYNMFKMTAAHKRLPIPSYVRVTNLDNGKRAIVRVNDRGPFHDDRIIDLSYVAARRLGVVKRGSAPVRIETVTPASLGAEREEAAPPERATRRTATSSAPATENRRREAPSGSASSSAGRAIPVADGPPSRRRSPRLYLQAGAFGEAANADRLRTRLEAAGFERVSIIEPSAATPLYRVRVGPFDDPRSRRSSQQILTDRGFAVRAVER